MKRLVIAAGFAIVLGASACSASTGGSGEPVGINRQSTSPSVSTSRASTSAPTTAAPRPTTVTPTTTTAPSTTPTTTAAPSTTPTTTGPPALPQILSVNASASCAGITTGVANGKITVTWTSLGTDQVWLLPSSVASALVGADAKTGGKGPYSPNGSASLSGAFDCGNSTGYVLVQPYKGGTGSAGIIQLIARA